MEHGTCSRQRGATATEYALLAAVIAASIISAAQYIGDSSAEGLQQVEAALPAHSEPSSGGSNSGGNSGGSGSRGGSSSGGGSGVYFDAIHIST